MSKILVFFALFASFSAYGEINSVDSANLYINDIMMRSPELEFETIVQVAEGRAKIFLAAGECVYKNDLSSTAKWKTVNFSNRDRVIKNAKAAGEKNPQVVSVFDGFHISPGAAARVALRKCLIEAQKRDVVFDIRFSKLNVEPMPVPELAGLRDQLKEELHAAGFRSCYPQVIDGVIQTVPSYCNTELPKQKNLKSKILTGLTYLGYGTLGAIAYRARGGGLISAGGKALWFLTAVGVGYIEGGWEGAAGGLALWTGSQLTPWGSGGGHCHDYGHGGTTDVLQRTKSQDAQRCWALFMVPAVVSAYTFQTFGGYDVLPTALAGAATGPIYHSFWNYWDNNKGMQQDYPGGPNELSEAATGFVRTVGLVATIRSKKQKNKALQRQLVKMDKNIAIRFQDNSVLQVKPIPKNSKPSKNAIDIRKNLELSRMMVAL